MSETGRELSGRKRPARNEQESDAERLSVRLITLLDHETLLKLVQYGHEALGESALDEWMLPVVASCGRLFVAEAGEAGSAGAVIVGSAEILRCMDAGRVYLEGMYIRQKFQGRGFGTILLDEVLRALAAEGYARMFATVAPGNEPAMRLYAGAGFSTDAFLPDHYGPGRDRLLMSAPLIGDG